MKKVLHDVDEYPALSRPYSTMCSESGLKDSLLLTDTPQKAMTAKLAAAFNYDPEVQPNPPGTMVPPRPCLIRNYGLCPQTSPFFEKRLRWPPQILCSGSDDDSSQIISSGSSQALFHKTFVTAATILPGCSELDVEVNDILPPMDRSRPELAVAVGEAMGKTVIDCAVGATYNKTKVSLPVHGAIKLPYGMEYVPKNAIARSSDDGVGGSHDGDSDSDKHEHGDDSESDSSDDLCSSVSDGDGEPDAVNEHTPMPPAPEPPPPVPPMPEPVVEEPAVPNHIGIRGYQIPKMNRSSCHICSAVGVADFKIAKGARRFEIVVRVGRMPVYAHVECAANIKDELVRASICWLNEFSTSREFRALTDSESTKVFETKDKLEERIASLAPASAAESVFSS